jgi:hypothetical protein
VLAFDVDFNREVVAEAGRYFSSPADVADLLEAAESDPAGVQRAGRRSRQLAARYDWDSVAAGYEQLALALAARQFPARRPSGRRSRATLPAPTLLPVPRDQDPERVVDIATAAVRRVGGGQQ